MPVEAVVVLTVVIAMFATFVIVVGGVWIWTNLSDRPARRTRQAVRATPASALR